MPLNIVVGLALIVLPPLFWVIWTNWRAIRGLKLQDRQHEQALHEIGLYEELDRANKSAKQTQKKATEAQTTISGLEEQLSAAQSVSEQLESLELQAGEFVTLNNMTVRKDRVQVVLPETRWCGERRERVLDHTRARIWFGKDNYFQSSVSAKVWAAALHQETPNE